MKYFLIFSIR